jgi:hypothetical protein
VQSAHSHSGNNIIEGQINGGQLGLHHKHQRSFAAIPMSNASLNVNTNVPQANSTSNNTPKQQPKTRILPSLTQANNIRSPHHEESKSSSGNNREQPKH